MAKKKTKSARIMELYAQGLSTREIADRVGCLDSYVRVVARQRKGRGASEIDKKYIDANREKIYARQRPKARQYMRDVKSLAEKAGALDCAKKAGRKASSIAQKNGLTAREISNAYGQAYKSVLYKAARQIREAA